MNREGKDRDRGGLDLRVGTERFGDWDENRLN